MMNEELKDQQEVLNEEEKGKQEEMASNQDSTTDDSVDSTEESTNQEEGNQNQSGELPGIDQAMEVIARLQVELRDTKKELDDHKDQLVRLQADFTNFRKRKEKEVANTIRFANEELLKDLLPILDNFDRTLDAIQKTDNLTAIKDGINLVNNNMRKQLGKVGVEPMDSKGKPFDSNLHEAITTLDVQDEDQKGKVIDVVEKGYKLKDKVLRFAKVVIGE